MPLKNIIPRLPILVLFETTYECDNKCDYCYNYYRNDRNNYDESDIDEKKHALENIKKSGTSIINYTGGEPLIYPEFIELLRFGKKLGFHQSINTNGRNVTNEMACNLKECGVARAKVSVSGSTDLNHDKCTRITGSWVETMNGIKTLRDYEIPVTINLTLTKQNYFYLEEVAKLANSLGADFSISRFIPNDNIEYRKFDLSNENMSEIMYTIKKLISNNIYVSLSTPIPLCATDNCDMGLINLCQCSGGAILCVISPNLSVRPCPINQYTVGNLRSEQLIDIWHSDSMNRWRDLSYSEECISCPFFSLCKGGCRQAGYVQGCSDRDPLSNYNNACRISNDTYCGDIQLNYDAVPVPAKDFIYSAEVFGATIFFEDNTYIFLLDDVSCDIWNYICDTNNTKDNDITSIINYISKKYQKNEDIVRRDCKNFISQLYLLKAVKFYEG